MRIGVSRPARLQCPLRSLVLRSCAQEFSYENSQFRARLPGSNRFAFRYAGLSAVYASRCRIYYGVGCGSDWWDGPYGSLGREYAQPETGRWLAVRRFNGEYFDIQEIREPFPAPHEVLLLRLRASARAVA